MSLPTPSSTRTVRRSIFRPAPRDLHHHSVVDCLLVQLIADRAIFPSTLVSTPSASPACGSLIACSVGEELGAERPAGVIACARAPPCQRLIVRVRRATCHAVVDVRQKAFNRA
jgi:hypothetical protein